jgi:hypothetical protein
MQVKRAISNLINSLEGNPYYLGQDRQDMLVLLGKDYLSKTGYIESISHKLPLRHGLPIPWITYSALEFLESNVSSNAKIFEIGAGFSSIFWALRGNDVQYLEFNKSWNNCISNTLDELSSECSISCKSILDDLSEKHPTIIGEFKQMLIIQEQTTSTNFSESLNSYILEKIERSNLIVIDGHYRNFFLEMCARANSKAVVVLDNSERTEYRTGKTALLDAGFFKIDFTGLGPVNPYSWTTSIFIKSISDLQAVRTL